MMCAPFVVEYDNWVIPHACGVPGCTSNVVSGRTSNGAPGCTSNGVRYTSNGVPGCTSKYSKKVINVPHVSVLNFQIIRG